MICIFLSLETIVSTKNKKKSLSKKSIKYRVSILPVCTPLSNYEIYIEDRLTTHMLLYNLSVLVRKTTEFTIETVHDF